jgi:hypothetical protein
MAITAGETSPSPAARVLVLLRQTFVARGSGELHLDCGYGRRGLFIREGHIVYAWSDVEGERLGEVFVRHGDVSQRDLDRALATAESGGFPLGSVLTDMGLVESAQLEEAVACHVRQILFSALDEPDCSPRFEAIESLPTEAATWDPATRLSTGQVLLEAARRLDDPAVVREAIGDPDRKLVLATDPLLCANQVALNPTDGFVLSRIDGTLSARELVGLIPLPAEETEKSLLGLLCAGAVDFAWEEPAEHAPPPGATPEATSGAPAPPEPGPEQRLEETIAAGEALLRDGKHFEAFVRVEPALGQAEGALRVRAQLVLGRACMKVPGWLKRGESYLLEVVHDDPSQVLAYLLLGEIYRASELPTRAAAMYRKALELQPSNRHARRAIAFLEGTASPDEAISVEILQ